MADRPEPSNCPLCGSPCRNSEDGDGNDTVDCTQTSGAVPANRWEGDARVSNECPYEVYDGCHEPLCLWVATLEAAVKDLGIRQGMSVEAMKAFMEETRRSVAVAKELMEGS